MTSLDQLMASSDYLMTSLDHLKSANNILDQLMSTSDQLKTSLDQSDIHSCNYNNKYKSLFLLLFIDIFELCIRLKNAHRLANA